MPDHTADSDVSEVACAASGPIGASVTVHANINVLDEVTIIGSQELGLDLDLASRVSFEGIDELHARRSLLGRLQYAHHQLVIQECILGGHGLLALG
jgi:hypothetical protein